jgi:hypothetical protein
MGVGRRVVMFVVAVIVLLAAASTPALALDTTSVSAACAHACGTGSSSVGTQKHPPQPPCVHDAGCGGGGALSTASSSLVLGVLAAPLIVACALVTRRHRSHRIVLRPGTLLADRLFHPPRLALGR